MTTYSINDYVAGAIGGGAGLIIGHPFDTIKVQMQTKQSSSRYKNTLDATKNINQQGWVRGFYRGLGFPLLSYGLVNSIFFGVYGNTLRIIAGHETPTNFQILLAGAVGGLFQLSVACPVDVVKVVLQSQIGRVPGGLRSSAYIKGPRDCLRRLYQTGGLRDCYRGVGVQALRDIPASGVYFLVYEDLYGRIQKRRWADSKGIYASLLAGGTAGVLSWYMIMPLDVIKSRLQADMSGRYTGIAHCASLTYQREGFRAFYTGAVVNSIRAFIVNAVIFAVHNQAMAFLGFIQTKKLGFSKSVPVHVEIVEIPSHDS